MRSQKGSRKIVVGNVEYRWRATGNDGYISISIWPTNNVGPLIRSLVRYYETWFDESDGRIHNLGNEIVVSNRLIKWVIEHAITEYGYDPQVRGNVCRLVSIDRAINWDDVIRGGRTMTEEEWLTCAPAEMYYRAIAQLKSSARKKDLFCLACIYLIWNKLEEDAKKPFQWLDEHIGEREPPRSTENVQERFEGLAQSLYDAHNRREEGIAGAATQMAYYFWLGWYEYAFPNLCRDYVIVRNLLKEKPHNLLVSIIHDIFGNPFCPAVVDPAWRTSTIKALARQIYETLDFSAMPILADALEDTGCDNADILSHCRQPGNHVKGCWVVDAVLGRK